MTAIKVPPTAAQMVRDLVHGAMHSDNLSEFIRACLVPAWREAGLPGELPFDADGFIDMPADDWPEYEALAPAFGAVSGLVVESEWATAVPAVFISVERSSDVGKIADAATAAGLDAYEFRRDVVVALRSPSWDGEDTDDATE